jgi:Domain of unknown function (DUF4157)
VKSNRVLERMLATGASNDQSELDADRIADKVMGMDPYSPFKNAQLPQLRIQRFTQLNDECLNIVPASVKQVLTGSGKPMELKLRQNMEQYFGHDFSHVRIHTDEIAQQSAHDINAQAYTIGSNIVFGAKQFKPGTQEGRRLLAHELTHVVQQASLGSHPSYSVIQRQEKKNPLDDKAKAIIAKAKDVKVDKDKRAIALVIDIIGTYYATDAAKVEGVEFDVAKAGDGLLTESVGSGKSAKGKIYVGNTFVENVDAFARRVLQVGHELLHIDQYRGGLAGGPDRVKTR